MKADGTKPIDSRDPTLDCKTPDYVWCFSILPLTFFHIDISADTVLMFVLIEIAIFVSAFLHQVLRAYRLQQVALVPVPSFAAYIANLKKRSKRIHPSAPSKQKPSPYQLTRSANVIPIETAPHIASGDKFSQTGAADLIAVAAIAKNTRVPAYCVRTRAGFVGCTCSPFTLNTHGKPGVCTAWYFVSALVAVLEACLAVVVVTSVATFNVWLALAAVTGGALGHSLTHWQAVTVVEVKEAP